MHLVEKKDSAQDDEIVVAASSVGMASFGFQDRLRCGLSE